MTRARSCALGPALRPVAVPDDLDQPGITKAHGCIELPVHIRWSSPSVVYDLDDRADAVRVYEQVMREGTDDDVRFYIDPARLVELWRELVPLKNQAEYDLNPMRKPDAQAAVTAAERLVTIPSAAVAAAPPP